MAERLSSVLRARVVLPVSQPPIDDGAVCISGNRITSVGKWAELTAAQRRGAVDLGPVVLMPGLVNAHCHLDYTDMAGQVPPPRTFTEWIMAITSIKGTWDYSDYAQSWINGARMLLRTGTTTVGDIEAVPALLPEVWETTRLRVISFHELINVRNQRPARVMAIEAAAGMKGLRNDRGGVGLSPHATYTATAELLEHSRKMARRHGWRVTTHVAESLQEFEMFMYKRGDMYDWLKKNGRDMSDCGHGSPVQRMEALGMLEESFLAVHVNYLWKDDARIIGRRKSSVAHCPRSHVYFGHRCFPLQELAEAGVNICLGTDSLVSTNKVRRQPLELNMFEEMRALAGSSSNLEPETIIRMETFNGARALGLAGEVGELARDRLADLIVVPLKSVTANPYEAVLEHKGDVVGSMIDGQ